MANYAIGDIQGCYDALQKLLANIQFNDQEDILWFVGDLVNRGKESLKVLRFIRQLPLKPKIALGNHDLYLLLKLVDENRWHNSDDTLQDILDAPERDEIKHWLRQQALLHYDERLNVVMCHAGIAPMWRLAEAKAFALELETVLKGDQYEAFLLHMRGNEPNQWSDRLQGIDRLRVICNYFTRMRLCDRKGALDFSYKGTIDNVPKSLYPWYEVPDRHEIEADIVFGHWAALQGRTSHPRIFALDTGCLWGGKLTALRLEDKQRFTS